MTQTTEADDGREQRIEALEALVLTLDLHPLTTKRSFVKFRKVLENTSKSKLGEPLERLHGALLNLRGYRLSEVFVGFGLGQYFSKNYKLSSSFLVSIIHQYFVLPNPIFLLLPKNNLSCFPKRKIYFP